ncbi:MAG: CvpA family protein [Rudaea sp.]|uniref:CvpA family protein n=1 Tax=Rudaea sp. TaxID=2136325 RepID=UPI0039E3131D
MNWADYAILAALALSVLMGLWRGFIGEVLALAVWAVAIWIAWRFGPQVAAAYTAIDLPSARIVLGYATCFVAVLIAGAIVGFLMRKLVAGSGLGGTDRLLGAVFGLARGIVLVTLTVLLLGFTPFPRDPWWHGSRLLPSFQNAAQWASLHMPPEVTKYLDLRGLLLPPAPPSSPPRSEPKQT